MDRSKLVDGVVLAGGLSSRMGTNKALLEFKGKTLIEYMMSLVASVCSGKVYCSGAVPGYKYLEDEKPHTGPAEAILSVVRQIGSTYRGILFVPVDMPNLTTEILRTLLQKEDTDGACFQTHPLPLFLNMPLRGLHPYASVRELIGSLNISELPLPHNSDFNFLNANTPEEWKTL